jgi:hypothetical protein
MPGATLAAMAIGDWRFGADLTSLLWIVVTAVLGAVIASGSRASGGQRLWRGVLIALAVMLAVAGSPAALVGLWELSALAAWWFARSAAGDEAEARAAGQMLISWLVMDGLLISAAAFTAASTTWIPAGTASYGMSILTARGMCIAAAGRCGLPPVFGWARVMRLTSPDLQRTLWWLGAVAPAAILFSRAGELLASEPLARTPMLSLLMIVTLMGLLTAFGQPLVERKLAAVPPVVAGVVGALLVGVGGRIGALLAVALLAAGYWATNSRVMMTRLDELLRKAPVRQPSTVQLLASRDWGVPTVWWTLVEIPLRAVAQFAWFFDGVALDRVVRMAPGEVSDEAVVDSSESSWVAMAGFVVVTGVLIAMALR